MTNIIAAISTALAPSGIGVIRLSGEGCAQVAARVLRPVHGGSLEAAPNRVLRLYDLLDREGRVIDRILAVYTRGPHSYTGEDTVELQCHGSPAVLTEALSHLFAQGARQALPGEFTKRAFLNGQMDLTAAEAVIDLIEAETADAAANAAGQVSGALTRKLDPVYEALVSVMSHFHAVLDYPDEDIDDFQLEHYRDLLTHQAQTLEALLATCRRGDVVKNGIGAVILGRPNAGKSSLLNALAGYDRVIVTDIPGTTRDTVEEKIRLGRLVLRLMDTAGIRDTGDVVEQLGVERAVNAAKGADLALVVIDGSSALSPEDFRAMDAARSARNAICILSKADLPQVVPAGALDFDQVLSVSAVTGQGLRQLEDIVAQLFASDTPCDGTLLTNHRHQTAVSAARDALGRVLSSLDSGATPDAVLLDLEDALDAIATLTGRSMREDITNDIFSRFCVGK
jgi:tRNA modification GTPase